VRNATVRAIDEATDRVAEPGLIALLCDLDIETLRKSVRENSDSEKPHWKRHNESARTPVLRIPGSRSDLAGRDRSRSLG
jgi:hypothetical protein